MEAEAIYREDRFGEQFEVGLRRDPTGDLSSAIKVTTNALTQLKSWNS